MQDTMLDREEREKATKDLETDPVLAMLGVGEQLWRNESGDRFIERLRAEEPTGPPKSSRSKPANDLAEVLWARIKKHEGLQFHTATDLPFSYKVDGNGVWFFRGGRKVNRKLTRTQFNIAITRCPLRTTTEIKDLMDYPYLFAVLMDRRIRQREY